MIPSNQTVAGIDVGGKKKGFHAIALSNGVFEKTTSTSSSKIVDWCLERNASVIAVDAPCGWSQSGSSRLAERTLEMAGAKIQCFATPTYADAKAHQKGFYDWVFNGEELYQQLTSHFPLFDGKGMKNQVCFETFPHAIVCALAAKVVPAKLKTSTRRDVLRKLGYDVSILTNVDFIDAALCAVAAVAFSAHLITKFGAPNDGFIVVPSIDFADPVKR